MSFDQCTEVSAACPVEATLYAYRPNLPGNSILLAVFGLCTIAQILFGVRYKNVAFSTVVGIGCVGELIGYAGRIIMHYNPWHDNGFKIQICCLVLAPSFLAAGIYLTLKHIVLELGPEKSRLKPKLYTWIFITCDVFSILLQAAGGGIAASGTGNLVNIGNSVIIAGIAFQVATMFVCLLLAADFAFALYRSRTYRDEAQEKALPHATSVPRRGFHYYLGCTSVAFLAIFIRSVYRLPEMAGGWGNPLMQNEKEFLILDGGMIALAALLMTVAHPGIFFPAMTGARTK
ncbi:Putative RTA-like protein [Septoria linicola]|uniref:RTA-like protein n=1 Tax=Septoria linicola TaxID=215465 RepID=A0A9Q9AN43_9PEZI|nr:putative RTA-like protein [Septoria linicola]USW49138.1 Putative RTA-like protein [Septoria linicola]